MTITTQKTTESRWDIFKARFKRTVIRYFTVQNVGVLLLVMAFVSGIYGHWHTFGHFQWTTLVSEFYTNASTEFFSIAVTVLIIDALNQRRQREEEKARLIRQMSSTERGLALAAAEELRASGAVKDGSLIGANLERANLHGVKLGTADLRRARMDFSDLSNSYLYFANLEHADMSGVDFRGATLTAANLRYADLVAAQLKGALLNEADLTYAKLDKAEFDESTLLPDQTAWHPTVDIKRFTNPDHPNYWRSEMEASPAFRTRRHVTSDRWQTYSGADDD